MKTKQFYATLKNVKTVITSNFLPILDNFYFKGGTVRGTNLETHIIAETEIKGNFIVNSNNLLKVLSVIPTDDFSLKILKEEVIITSKNLEFKLNLEKKEDYPKMPECNILIGNLTKLDIKNIIKVSKIIANDDLRPALCRVYVSKEKEYCGTDAHCLSWGKTEGCLKSDIFIPKLAILKNLNECEIFSDGLGNIKLKSDNYEVIFRNFDGKYVDYHAILPEKHLTIIKCDKKELINLVSAGLSCTNSTTKQGILQTKKGKLILTSENLDFFNSMQGNMKIERKGKEVRIGVNLVIFKRILSLVNENEIEIKLNEPNRAILINNNALVMPVMLNE